MGAKNGTWVGRDWIKVCIGAGGLGKGKELACSEELVYVRVVPEWYLEGVGQGEGDDEGKREGMRGAGEN